LTDATTSEQLTPGAPGLPAERIRAANEYLASSLGKGFLSIWGLLVLRDRLGGCDFRDLDFGLGPLSYKAGFFPKAGLRVPGSGGFRVGLYQLRIPRQDVEVLPAQTAVRLTCSADENTSLDTHLGYSQLSRTLFARHSRLFRVHQGTSRLFVRQGGRNRMFLTLREANVTDTLLSQAKVLAARIAALVHKKNVVLLYEKESSRYEESAAVVFESLLDSGHDDVHFILDAKMLHKVPERYRSKVVKRFSFGHFYYLFAARALVGTELVAHAMELRTIDRVLLHHLSSAKFTFVFLQHGVMYMVSLDSAQRGFFRAGSGFPKKAKIICSSEREKRHFVELAGFASEDMYVCGLPKFDHAERAPEADRILIMPTWRPWEYNTIRTNPEQSGYLAMLAEMYGAVPAHLKDRVWILPHPLVRESLKSTPLDEHIWAGDSYDAALRLGTVLITDYSSVAYDAFYRGANVVFWWRDKDECMEKYGGHLMLEEGTAFGPVCYDVAALGDAVASAYDGSQDPEYVRRYDEIVEYRDGGNTRRLIEMMERDHLV
jgi:hypothetical protein